MADFISKSSTEDTENNNLVFNEEELVLIYNALGCTATSMLGVNGFVQDIFISSLVEDSTRSVKMVQLKIMEELHRRNFES